jgi:hypothetical protein
MVIDGLDKSQAPVMLVVGNLRGWTRDGRTLPNLEGFHFAGFSQIEPGLLERIDPEIVLSALMGQDFDAVDLARRLSEAGFRGRYRAVTTALPRPEAIKAEVRAAAPGIDFDLFVID